MQHAQVNIEVTLGTPALPLKSVYQELAPATTEPRKMANALWRLFNAIAGRLRQAKVRIRVDGITDYAARITLAVAYANIAAGESIDFAIPGVGSYRVAAVASGADATLGTFVSQTSNTVTAAAMATAINGMYGLKNWVFAESSVGNLTITSLVPGAFGNRILVIDNTVNGITGEGLLTGGLEAHAQVTASLSVEDHASLTAATDTTTIGNTVLTWVAGAPAEGEVLIGADDAEDADNLATAINAHTDLAGLVRAAADGISGVTTLTFLIPAREALQIRLAVSDAVAQGVTQPSTNLTLVSGQATREYDFVT
jgi:hypothetical protein